MNPRVTYSVFAGAGYGLALGLMLIQLGSIAIGGPVVPVAQLSILTMTILPGAALGLLAAFERA